jgi:5'-3' exonuclease
MGIPSYFSYLLKRQRHIIKAIPKTNKIKFDSLYLDCNSIIYDSYYTRAKDGKVSEPEIITETIHRIKQLITHMSPRNVVYIAFDGVAPFAKIEQQRSRRYKSWVMSKIGIDTPPLWNTSSITPGTEFMAKLMSRVKTAFIQKESSWNVQKIIVSGSDEPGEGEHKLFGYIRANPTTDQVAVYGLDADLIMLSLIHTKYCGNIHICREAPEFGDLRDESQPKNTLLGVDTNKLIQSIYDEMGCGGYIHSRVLDYIFMCFFLGNDFMPHFPAMNIRTQGIRVLMDTYKQLLKNNAKYTYLVSSENGIHWNTVLAFIKELADKERGLFTEEYRQRHKLADHYERSACDMNKKELWDNIPLLYRGKEMYIYPSAAGWEGRYYATLFGAQNVQDITRNYIEGLEWVYRYYTTSCPDWKWKYHYNYAPLLTDLYGTLRDIPDGVKFQKNTAACTPDEQLKYVIPRAHWAALIPSQKDTKYVDAPLPPLHELFEWSFCKYMWEAHVKVN